MLRVDGDPDMLDGAAAVISARVALLSGAMWMLGETFQPWPSSRAAAAPVPCVARPPCPGAPPGFSGLIERVTASESSARLPRLSPNPLNLGDMITSVVGMG